ncbi:uncharacterized protein [Diabrotica undecimpunctata]|uniref:uncharacterized protein n=1 Tax=Diabrotica undecimpunctata TaxID=50387 RepID=UPI003B634AA1
MDSHKQHIHDLNNARLAFLLHRYKELNIKKMLQKSKIFFNNQCLRFNLLPSYVKGRLREFNFTTATVKQINILGRSIIRDEIRKIYQTIYTIDLQLKATYDNIHIKLTPQEFDEWMCNLHGTLDYLRRRQYRKSSTKINNLKYKTNQHNNNRILSTQTNNDLTSNNLNHNSSHIPSSYNNSIDVSNLSEQIMNNFSSSSSTSSLNETPNHTPSPNTSFSSDPGDYSTTSAQHPFYAPFINYSTTVFSTNETNLLQKGFKFNPPLDSRKQHLKNLELLGAECESILTLVPNDHTEEIRDKLKVLFRKDMVKSNNTHNHRAAFRSNNNFKHVIKSINQKITENNLTITKADKGNTVVVLNTSDYTKKVLKFIDDNKFITKAVNIKSFTNKVKTLINDSNEVLDAITKKKLSPNKSIIPRLYGLLKIHKTNIFEDIPIRPVVSFSNSPTFALATYLNQFLKTLYNNKFEYIVNNNLSLANKLTSLKFSTGDILISLDITNLFTNIPTQEVISIITMDLWNNNYSPNQIIEYAELLNICLSQNFFNFNNETFVQPDGLAMGSPLSPILADIFLNDLESNKILNNNPFTNYIKFYSRYVDDTFIVWGGSLDNLHSFLDYLNQLHHTIKFTLEIQDDSNSLNFLDLTLTLNNSTIILDIYRKPTHTGTVIPADSHHPIQHKMAAFYSYINRLISLPLTLTSFNKELKIIQQIAINNGYSINLVNKILHKKTNRMLEHQVYTQHSNEMVEQKPYRSLTYIGDLSYKIAKIFDDYINISFKTASNLGLTFLNNKDKRNSLEYSGVYKLSCHTCNACYIGRTFRSFNIRLKEHLRYIERPTSGQSHFSQHIRHKNHNFDPQTDFTILHTCNKGLLLNNLEHLEILKSLKNHTAETLNAQLELEYTPVYSVLI